MPEGRDGASTTVPSSRTPVKYCPFPPGGGRLEGWDGGSEGEGVGLYQDSRETPPFLTCTVTLTTPGMSAWKTVLAVPSRVRVRMGTKHIQTA